jgi:hypothetical protein
MIYAALAFLVVAVVGSAAYAATRGWRLYRTFRATAGNASAAIGRVAEAAAKAESHAAALPGTTEALATANARLKRALDELAVLRNAAARPQSLLASIRGTVPRK